MEIKPELNRLEKRLFEIICLLIILVMIHGVVQGLLLYGYSLTSLMNTVTAAVAGLLLYLSRTHPQFEGLRSVLVIFLNLAILVYWFRLSGYYGPTAVGMIAVGVGSIILVPSPWRLRFLILFCIMVVSLVTIQIKTDWVLVRPLEYETLPYDYTVISIAVLLVISYLKSEFDKERRVVLQQNNELKYLNSQLKKALDDKDKAQAQLIESEKLSSVGKLTAGLAHELNNPLNYIGGIVTPMQHDLDDLKTLIPKDQQSESTRIFEDIDALMEGVKSGTARASSIIEQLVKISPNSSKEPDDLEELDLEELIQTFTKIQQNNHPNLQLKLTTDGVAKVNGNSTELLQSINNIFQNSLEVIPEKNGSIQISLHQQGRDLKLRINDNGGGIDTKHLNHVFDPFYTSKPSGSGLGLYISYTIIQKHRGRISMDNVNGGAQTTITLPLA